MILLGNKILKEQLKKSELIRADHNERIRILEIAIQQCQNHLNKMHHLTPLEQFIQHTLNSAMKESHKIAIKEY